MTSVLTGFIDYERALATKNFFHSFHRIIAWTWSFILGHVKAIVHGSLNSTALETVLLTGILWIIAIQLWCLINTHSEWSCNQSMMRIAKSNNQPRRLQALKAITHSLWGWKYSKIYNYLSNHNHNVWSLEIFFECLLMFQIHITMCFIHVLIRS